MSGAFNADADRGHGFAATLGIDPVRTYDDYKAMIASEGAREDRIDAVEICTLNYTHFPIAKAFLEAGYDVICEKPLTNTLEDAIALERLVWKIGRFMGVTYTDSGYPMVHEAREMVMDGKLGRVLEAVIAHGLSKSHQTRGMNATAICNCTDG